MMSNIIVYGIPNCDTIKKTMNWFAKNKIKVEFHDYKISGISKEKLSAWCGLKSWDVLLNKKSTTWRSLPVDVQEKIKSSTAAIKVMMENNSIIKRPVIEYGNDLIAGFNEEEFKKAFNKLSKH